MIAKCIDCGTEVDYRQKRCRKCYDKSRERWVFCQRIGCEVRFKASPSHKRKFCSKKCEAIGKTGKPGKKPTEWTKQLISNKNKGISRNAGKSNAMWKGDGVGYASLHRWVARHKPKPELCEICQKVPPDELALVAREYVRDTNVFKWACEKCHGKMDAGYKWNDEQKEKIRQIAKKRTRNTRGRFE